MHFLAILKIFEKKMDEGNIGCGIFVGLKKPFDTVEYIFFIET